MLDVPRPPTRLVRRPRLLDRLDAGVRGAVTLVAAQAGAGKTVLLSSWVAAGDLPGPVAWPTPTSTQDHVTPTATSAVVAMEKPIAAIAITTDTSL